MQRQSQGPRYKLKGEVREFDESIDNLRARLEDCSREFKAGQIRRRVPQWEEITRDKDILKMIEGVDIEFSESPLPPH